jgi:hypothetical protein
MRLRKKKAEPVHIPYHPWAIPPMGSLGDAWDEESPLLNDSLTAARADEERRKRERERGDPKPTDFKPIILERPLNWIAIGGWVLLFMALTSTGPALSYRPMLGMAALVAALSAIVQIKFAAFQRGLPEAITAAVAALGLLSWHYYAPQIMVLFEPFR